MAWEPSGERIGTISESHVYLWNIEQNDTPQVSATGNVDSKSLTAHKLACCRWNPHASTSQIATALGPHVRGWDLRTMKWEFLFRTRSV